jgi:hypothetical protein
MGQQKTSLSKDVRDLIGGISTAENVFGEVYEIMLIGRVKRGAKGSR